MKQKLQGLIAGLLIGTLLTGGLVFAKQAQEMISVMYSNIKIQIDGVEFTPKDANGGTVEPFIYNGTTYLPVRGIAGAFGSEVNWSPETMTVSLGSSQFDWLEQMGYVDYYTDGNANSFSLYSDDTTKRGMKATMNFVESTYKNLKLGDIAKQKTTYMVSKKYDKFYATVSGTGEEPVTIKIYGDNNKVLYMMSTTKESKPVDIIVDVSNNEFLYFETSGTVGQYSNERGDLILGNARFSKK